MVELTKQRALLLVVYLQLILAGLAAPGLAALADSRAQKPYWVMGSQEPEVGQSTKAWLTVPRGFSPEATTDVQIILHELHRVRIWFLAKLGLCGNPPPMPRNRKTVDMKKTAIIPVCFQMLEPMTFRLIAEFQPGKMRSTEENQSAESLVTIVESGPISERREPLSPFYLAIFSSVAGMLTGGGLWFLQRRIETHYSGKALREKSDIAINELREKSENTIVTCLLPEIQGNLAIMQKLNSTMDPKFTLKIGQFEMLTSDSGFLSFLAKDRRESYLVKLKTLYDPIFNLNISLRAYEASPELEFPAQEIKNLLEKYESFLENQPNRGS